MPVIKIPREIRMGSHRYKVMFDEREEDSDFRGSCLHRHHEILLNPYLHPQQLRVTLLHEVFHLIAQTFEVRPPEEDVSRLAEGWGEFLFEGLGVDFDFSGIEKRNREGDRTK